MKISELKKILTGKPDAALSILLPDGELIPANFHITEVGYISKKFIDCGGTKRSVSICQLQIWLGQDTEHRLTSGKAAKILDLGDTVLPAEDLDVEIEYEDCTISQYAVKAAQLQNGAVVLELEPKHTDCLALEACGITDAAGSCCAQTDECR